MISVFVQNKFLAEKKYILGYLLGDVLKLDYEIKTDNYPSYRFISGNNRLEIKDAFFSKLEDKYAYYNDVSLIPETINYLTCEGFDNAFPVLFGDENLQNEDGYISCGNDIIAATFFMLSRWEEIANDKRDTHDRFCEKESLAVRFGFYNRPIVNEYIELFVKMMNDAGINIMQPDRSFRVFLTHDVDDIARYDKISKIFKAFGGDLIKRKSLIVLFKSISDVFKIKILKKKDVYDTFDEIMDISDSKGLKSRFYFIPGRMGEDDVRYNIDGPITTKIIDNIKKRGHIIGVHPSYSSYCNEKQFSTEIDRLTNIAGKISEGRQHYLRFKVPDTWQTWENNLLKNDSSVGFYDLIGFRSGICYEFPVFNFISKQQLNLAENPLIIMDTALKKISTDKDNAVEKAKAIIDMTKKYNGDFVFLWHNSNMSVNEWQDWKSVYHKIVNYTCE